MRRRALRRLRGEDGVGMVELLVVMPMLTILLGGLVVTLVTVNKWNRQTQEQTAQQTAARAAIDTFVRDVQGAFPVDPGTGVALPIVTATASALTFYAPDSAPTSSSGASFHLRKIAYRFTSNQLQRQSVASTNAYQVGNDFVLQTWTFPAGTFPSSSAWVTQLGPPDGQAVTGSFTYLGVAGSALDQPVSPGDVAAVKIALTVTTGGEDSHSTTFQDVATLRETSSW